MIALEKSRIYEAPPALLFEIPAGFVPTIDSFDLGVPPVQQWTGYKQQNFVVSNPSARVGLTLTVVLWELNTGTGSASFVFDATMSGRMITALWLATAAKVPMGWAPLTNLAGSIGAGSSGIYGPNAQTIPIDASYPLAVTSRVGYLQGFQLDIQGGHAAVMGALQNRVIGSLVGTHHGWNATLYARWEAVGSEICDGEWAHLKSLMKVDPPQPFRYTV